MSFFEKDLNLKFPYGEHEDCRALTTLTFTSIPKDGSLGKKHDYKKNGVVWRPGDKSDSLFFVQHGRVAINSVDREGRELIIRTVLSGEPFGEMCFCDGPTKTRQTTALALAESSIVEIKIAHFIKFMQSSDEVLGQVTFTFCIRLAEAERRVEILALHGAEERLGNALLYLIRRRGIIVNSEKPELIKLMVTHDELAGFTALSRQRVTITMNNFRARGLVAYDRNQPLVVNAAELSVFLGTNSS